MSNLTNNRLNIELTQAQIDAVTTAFTTLQNNLPFLIGLTTEERIALPKINVNNKVFTEDALNEMQQNPDMLPSFMNASTMQTDINLYNQLDGILSQARQWVEKLEDTQMLAGSEAYVSALTGYKLFGAAAAAGISGADAVYDSLKARFTQQGNTNTEENNNTISS